MLNLKFVYEVEKQFIKFKYSLRILIREVVKKGLSRMYKFDFKDLKNINLLNDVLQTNLSEQETELLNKFLKIMGDTFNKLVQQFIDDEIKEFEKQNPNAIKNGTIRIRRQSILGPIDVITNRYRNAEFKSILIKTKCRTFFFDTMILAMLILNGLMTYEGIKTFFGCFNMKISNSEIARISNIVSKFIKQEIDKHESSSHKDQKVVFVDGQWINTWVKKAEINHETGEVTYIKEKERVVRLTAIGIDNEGKKKVLTSIFNNKEDSTAYSMLLSKLKNELGIQNIDLIVSDGSNSLNDPLLEFYPNTKRQRCFFHIMRDLKLNMYKKQRGALVALIWPIMKQNSKQEALKYFESISKDLRLQNPRVFLKLEKVIDSLLNFYDLPRVLWKSSYTNNISENFNSAFRRSSPSNTCFRNIDSVILTSKTVSIKLNAKYKHFDLR